MDRGLKEQVKTVIHSLLVPHARGLMLDVLLREYADCEGQQLPFRTLGYNNPLDFLQCNPDVVTVTKVRSGHIVVQAVPREGVSHIQELVAHQNNSKSNSVKKIKNLLMNNQVGYRNPPCAASHFNAGRPVFGSGRWQYSQTHHQPTFTAPSYNSFQQTNGNSHQNRPPPAFKETLLPHISTKQNVEYENKIVTELINLINSYPNGIDINCIDVFYIRIHQRPIDWDCIQKGLTAVEFFEKHQNKFSLRLKDARVYVSLRNASKSMQITEAKESGTTLQETEQTSSGLQQVPETKHQAQSDRNSVGAFPEAWPKDDSHSKRKKENEENGIGKSEQFVSEIEWVAADARQDTQTLQAILIPPKNETSTATSSTTHKPRTENSSYNKVTPISNLMGNPRKPFTCGGISETFGVRRPDVDDVCTPDTYIPHEQYPEVSDFDFIFIIVAEVYTPGKFYWFLNKNRKAIEQLTDDLVLFYNLHEEYVCSLKEMYIGQLVAARYVDNLWYRAQITNAQNGEFQVFYIDYGSSGSVTIDKIRHLPLHFAKMPVQAFRGRLYGIKPAQSDKWSTEASNCFLKLIKGSRVIAAAKMEEDCLMINENDYEISYALTLVDTNSEKDLHISEHLIEQGLAEDAFAQQDDTSNGFATANPVVPTLADAAAEQPFGTSFADEVQLACELEKCLNLSNGNESIYVEEKRQTTLEVRVADNGFSSSSISSMSPTDNVDNVAYLKRQVKRIDLDDRRSFFIIKDDGQLYLTKYELLQLIPDLESRMENTNMKVGMITKDSSAHPELFVECLIEQTPWIKDAGGDVITILPLYLLRHIPTLLFLFGKDRAASAAFEAQLKDTYDPYWEEPRQIIK